MIPKDVLWFASEQNPDVILQCDVSGCTIMPVIDADESPSAVSGRASMSAVESSLNDVTCAILRNALGCFPHRKARDECGAPARKGMETGQRSTRCD